MWVVIVTFIVTILLWVIPKDVTGIDTNTVSMIPMAIFAITGVITAKDMQEINWSVIWMVAGGFAIGLGMNGSGLADAAIESIPFGNWSPIVILAISGLICYFLSNFISNTATAALLVPILAVVCRGMGIDKPIIGGDGFNGAEFVQQATAERASNIYFISGFSTTVDVSDKAKAFLEAYRAKYNEDPSTFAALAYDSVYLVANAAKGAKTSVDVKNNLAKTQNFEGVTGQTSFDADHNTVKTAFMMTMNSGKVEAAEVAKP